MKWFSNLKVAYKVLLSCLVFILLITAIAFQGITSMRTAAGAFDTFYKDRFIPVRQLNRIMRNLLQIRVNILQEFEAAKTGNWAEVEKRMKYSQELAEEYMKLWKDFESTDLTVEEKKMAEEWIKLGEGLREARGKYGAAIKANNMEQAGLYLAEWHKGYAPLRDMTDKLIALQQNEAEKLKAEEEKMAQSVIMLSLIFFGVAVLVGIIITFVLARSISGPVAKGLAFAQKIAEGDFTERIDLDQRDELGQLGHALNKAADGLEKLISEITVSAQNLAQAVEQIASGNQNLSQRTSEQASSLEEVASTIEEATAAIRQNAENSEQANKLSGETTKLAEEGNRVMKEAVNQINEINKSSKKIEEIISLINEISFQTNLLALNAAVEAARAGEQGRGFAVVAGEVRNLAQRSANAAKEIGALIKDSIDKIIVGTDLANKSGESLGEIVESMKNVARLVSEIAAASHEQKQGIDQINIAVSEMDNMTQQNAALVEETASASEEMASQANELNGMVEKFKINQDELKNIYASKHREVHVTAAGTRAPVKKDGNGAGKIAVEHHKPATKTEKDVAGLMKEEGFEEF